MALPQENIIRKYRSRIERLIEQCPETSEQSKGCVTPFYGGADREKARDFLESTAVIVAELIADDKATWEVHINRPVDIFFGATPTPEQLDIRNRVGKAFEDIADAYRRFVDTAIQMHRNSDCEYRESPGQCETTDCERQRTGCFRKHLRGCLRGAGPLECYDGVFDIEDALGTVVAELSKEPLLKPEEYFKSRQNLFGGMRESASGSPCASTPGDHLSILAVKRLSDLLDRFNEWNGWCENPAPKPPLTMRDVCLVEFDIEDMRNRIAAIRQDLLKSRLADMTHPFIVLGQIYFAYYSIPDESILHLPPEVLAEEQHSSLLRGFMPVEIVKDALNRIIGGNAHKKCAAAFAAECISGRDIDRETPRVDDTEKAPEEEPKTIGERFSFLSGQALFDGQSLPVGTGAKLDMLQQLAENFGKVVAFKALDDNSNPTEGSEKIRAAKSRLSSILTAQGLPVVIENRLGIGYIMLPKGE